MTQRLTREGLRASVGCEIGLSHWATLDAARVAAFADITDDRQPIHLDPAAGSAAGFEGAVAHGFLTLSMLSSLSYTALPAIDGQKASVNYGFDRVRFVTPVPVGARVRARFTLQATEQRDMATEMLTLAVLMEIASASRPALTADWRILLLF